MVKNTSVFRQTSIILSFNSGWSFKKMIPFERFNRKFGSMGGDHVCVCVCEDVWSKII